MAGAPPGFRNSYQRIPTELPAVTEWLTTSDSWSPKFRYESRYISRSARESRRFVVPLCGMQVPPPLQAAEKAATGIALGPVKVDDDAVAQSTLNFQRSSWFMPKRRT